MLLRQLKFLNVLLSTATLSDVGAGGHPGRNVELKLTIRCPEFDERREVDVDTFCRASWCALNTSLHVLIIGVCQQNTSNVVFGPDLDT